MHFRFVIMGDAIGEECIRYLKNFLFATQSYAILLQDLQMRTMSMVKQKIIRFWKEGKLGDGI